MRVYYTIQRRGFARYKATFSFGQAAPRSRTFRTVWGARRWLRRNGVKVA